jgi:hypothetical protein
MLHILALFCPNVAPIYKMAMEEPRWEAVFLASPWLIPMFHADFPGFTSSIMRRRRTVPNEKELDGLYLWRKDPKNENEQFTKAVELEPQAVLGRMARTAHCRCILAST